ncbi:AraC family transcriptional regulator [Amycolatopsis saalfeldensis]|uniref:AraC-type DNA-binding protein n=1 Tax=Amycolatopsis saalfeldensis TaxID=394193 RepID=A0A1H8VW20_9PSEU|nr:AraC family transcriptional regulator [Amycolatopsis saalfeldensis]SEP19437.1 AraC-type DNA-binding protein [Amycolatopsis saalfeldensis]
MEVCQALRRLLGDVEIEHVFRDAPTTVRLEIRAGAETAIGTGAHDLLRGTWQIGGGGKSIFLAVFDQARTTVLTQGRRIDVPAGHLFAGSSEVPFTVIQEGACRWHVIRVGGSLIQLPPATVDRVLYRPYALSPQARQLIENIMPITAGLDGDGQPAVDVAGLDHYLSGLAELILRSIHATGPDAGPGTARREHIERYIRRNLTDPRLCVGSVAAAHAVSRRRLYQLFDGAGVARFIRRARIDKAKALLADPAYRDQSIRQIAESVGIRSAQHFSHLFREATGESPLSFRRNAVIQLGERSAK